MLKPVLIESSTTPDGSLENHRRLSLHQGSDLHHRGLLQSEVINSCASLVVSDTGRLRERPIHLPNLRQAVSQAGPSELSRPISWISSNSSTLCSVSPPVAATWAVGDPSSLRQQRTPRQTRTELLTSPGTVMPYYSLTGPPLGEAPLQSSSSWGSSSSSLSVTARTRGHLTEQGPVSSGSSSFLPAETIGNMRIPPAASHHHRTPGTQQACRLSVPRECPGLQPPGALTSPVSPPSGSTRPSLVSVCSSPPSPVLDCNSWPPLPPPRSPRRIGDVYGRFCQVRARGSPMPQTTQSLSSVGRGGPLVQDCPAVEASIPCMSLPCHLRPLQLPILSALPCSPSLTDSRLSRMLHPSCSNEEITEEDLISYVT